MCLCVCDRSEERGVGEEKVDLFIIIELREYADGNTHYSHTALGTRHSS